MSPLETWFAAIASCIVGADWIARRRWPRWVRLTFAALWCVAVAVISTLTHWSYPR